MGRIRSRTGAGQEQARSKARARQKHEQGRNRAGTGQELSRVKQSLKGLKGAGQEYGRGLAEAGAGGSRVGAEQEHERSRRVARWE